MLKSINVVLSEGKWFSTTLCFLSFALMSLDFFQHTLNKNILTPFSENKFEEIIDCSSYKFSRDASANVNAHKEECKDMKGNTKLCTNFNSVILFASADYVGANDDEEEDTIFREFEQIEIYEDDKENSINTMEKPRVTLGERKLQELKKMVADSSPSYILEFNSTGYLHYVLQSPRRYNVLMLFTIDRKKQCLDCRTYEQIVDKIAQYYALAEAEEKEGGAKKDDSLPIIFGKMNLAKSIEIAQLHMFSTVPLIAFIDTTLEITEEKAGIVTMNAKLLSSNSKIQYVSLLIGKENMLSPNKMSNQGDQLSVDFVLDWVNRKAGRSVFPKKKLLHRLGSLSIMILVLALLCLLLFIGYKLVHAYPLLLPIASIIIQIISTSGLFYSVLFNMKFFGYDPATKQINFIAQSSRLQYLGEGLMMSAAVGLCALPLLLIINLDSIKFFRNGRMKRQFAAALLLSLFIFLLYFIFTVYRFKLSWYMPLFFPPNDYVRGSIKNDRGNSF